MSNSERMIIVLNDQFLPPKEFTDKRLVFGDAQVTTDNDRNTKVDIDGIPGKGYYGGVTVYYNRLNIQDLISEFTYRSDQQMTKEIVITNLANRYGIEIDPDDFEDFEIPTLEEGQNVILTLTIKPTSVQWTGSIQAYLEYGKAWLDAEVTRTTLDRLKHPNPSTTRSYARLATWGYDFSGIQLALKPTAQGNYTDWNTVSALCQALGIAQFTANKIVDKPTSQVPDANPLFQRVVIQSTVYGGLLQGPLYFHYNPF